MAHDVFVSYATEDKPLADAVVATLEGNAIRCWIAPRDILPGTDWGDSIMAAIGASRAVVLVFTARANVSAQVRREIQTGFEQGRVVVPLRVEDVRPERSLAYYLTSVHWLDAIAPPFTEHLIVLAKTVQQVLSSTGESVGAAKTPTGSTDVPLPDSEHALGNRATLPPESKEKFQPSSPTISPAPVGKLPARLVWCYVFVCIGVGLLMAVPMDYSSDREARTNIAAVVFAPLLISILVSAVKRQHVGLFVIGVVGVLTVVLLSQLSDPTNPGFAPAILMLLGNVATVFFVRTKFW